MKTTILLSTMFLMALALVPIRTQSQESLSPALKVLYFHGNNRCLTCNNMEKFTRELLKQEYQKELERGKIIFETFNFDDDANKEIVKKYKVESSSLLLVKTKNGKEKVSNITDIGFSYAKTDPERFKKEVRRKLNEKLL